MTIAIGNDHTAFALKQVLAAHMRKRGHDVTDFGTEASMRAEYPVYAEKVAAAVASGAFERGILLCGTGAGMSIAANKVNGIRAIVCSEPYTAKLSSAHNESNVLCLGARVVGEELAKMIVDAWLDTVFEGGRHQQRVDMIMAIEKQYRA